MEDKHELNDIILNKTTPNLQKKRVVLAVATLGVVLIIIVMLLNTLKAGDYQLKNKSLTKRPVAIYQIHHKNAIHHTHAYEISHDGKCVSYADITLCGDFKINVYNPKILKEIDV